MNSLKYICFTLFIMSLVQGCFPDTDRELTNINIDLSDQEIIHTFDLQDRGEVDSILRYTDHKNPALRYLVANAFASLQDERGLDSLAKLTKDPVMDIRAMAAYAIGQTGSSKGIPPLLEAFKNKDTLDINNTMNSSILEAIGKIGDKNLLRAMATVETYRNTDTLLLLGQVRGIFQYALRNITIPEGTDRMVNIASDKSYPEKVRLIAATYLARAKNIDFSASKFTIAKQFTEEKNPFIRMALASALGKVPHKDIFEVLKSQLETEPDYRVKVNILKSLKKYNYIDVIDLMIKYIEDSNPMIAETAASYLVTNGLRTDASIYKEFIKPKIKPRIQAIIYTAILKYIPLYYINTRKKITDEILEKIDNQKNVYDKAAFISALGYAPEMAKEVYEMTHDAKQAIIRTTGAESLIKMLSITRKNYQKKDIYHWIKKGIQDGDAGPLAVYGEGLASQAENLKYVVDSIDYIKEAISKIKLPQEIESYNSLSKALSVFSGTPYEPKTVAWNHPINWNLIQKYGDSVHIVIKTEKGPIRLELFSSKAPGSVANFLDLTKKDFFDEKTFHRVVPNFVIQGGCPRGDGYGALDYTIRSEFAQLYYEDEGYIGMASAGPNTEGTQFFITHSPTPHLNGRYTIFGKVVQGMDVIHQIEIGDKIIDVIIITP